MADKKQSDMKYENGQKLTLEEAKQLIQETGTVLSEEELDAISGGWGNGDTCPPGQHDYQYKRLEPSPSSSGTFRLCVCTKCGDAILE